MEEGRRTKNKMSGDRKGRIDKIPSQRRGGMKTEGERRRCLREAKAGGLRNKIVKSRNLKQWIEKVGSFGKVKGIIRM
jgi:hypothetical protein